MHKTLVTAALGECVHIAGIMKFQHIAESAGWKIIYLGPAVPITAVVETALKEKADMVGVSYRLTPETGERLLADFAEAADELHHQGVRFVFGGTPTVAEKVKNLGFFEKIFIGGESEDEVLAYLEGKKFTKSHKNEFPQSTLERIQTKAPFPLIRHHFGLPTMEATIDGIKKIADSEVLDVISLGIDQDAQENFFHPEKQDPARKGAGGVPVRTKQDYETLFAASRCGNYPLMRTYSGTDDFIKLAEMYMDTIHNAWCAIPLFWFNQMDGRGPWDLENSIIQHQALMDWYGEKGIPVEVNEPHHWGMRDAPDVIYVTSAYLSAYNARAFGVKDYIAQFMFNCPPGLSDAMDLAKMLAVLQMIKPLENKHFKIWIQTRTGLLSYPIDPFEAKAHLSASIYLQMALQPDILHVVGHTEAHHAATADDVIEACTMARRVIQNTITGAPNMTTDPKVIERMKDLVNEANRTLVAITRLAVNQNTDPLTNPTVLARAVVSGIMDAPQLQSNKFARGKIKTNIIAGCCVAVNDLGDCITESQRLAPYL